MKKSDKERPRKIVSTWGSLRQQIQEHNITAEWLMNDEFLQRAVTTPLYNMED